MVIFNSILTWEKAELNTLTREVFYANHPISLTPTEFSLLETFMMSGRCVLNRIVLAEECWPKAKPPSEATIKSHISSLRQKLCQAGAPPDWIETLHGVGYRLKA
jgi:DNA-binding response OmpR family regulator